MLEVAAIPAFDDNYLWAAWPMPNSDRVFVVDPGDPDVIQNFLESTGQSLDIIFVTHHHADHMGGVERLKQEWPNVRIFGPASDAGRLPFSFEPLSGGEVLQWQDIRIEVMAVPGHTLGHIGYWLPQESKLFIGDTLFSLGCGRMFEGNPVQFWESLSKIRELPDDTLVYCAHEYTASNARFALSLEPNNAPLGALVENIHAQRAAGKATVPMILAQEKKFNPFLRADDPAIARAVGLNLDAEPAQVFAAVRRAKDNFRG